MTVGKKKQYSRAVYISNTMLEELYCFESLGTSFVSLNLFLLHLRPYYITSFTRLFAQLPDELAPVENLFATFSFFER